MPDGRRAPLESVEEGTLDGEGSEASVSDATVASLQEEASMDPKAIYTIAEMARLAGISRYRTLRTLESAGVRTDRLANRRVVFLADLRDACPAFWDSILARRAAGGEGRVNSGLRNRSSGVEPQAYQKAERF
jgi:hypothetical protein